MRTITAVIIVLVCICSFIAISQFRQVNKSPEKEEKVFDTKKIIVLPLGSNNTATFINETYKKINEIIPGAILRAPAALPAFAYYKPRHRYRADSLIKWMNQMAKPGEVYIGITTIDISTTKGSNKDFGVMGLGYQPGKACVASPFRLKDKNQFWKIALHELGHTAGLPHCATKTCLMRDAEGGDHTAAEKEFCHTCKSKLLQQGWQL
jgi:archaemetzincin